METNAMPKEIAEAIITVMEKVGYVQKKGTNTFHNYKFAAVGDILAKVQPAMAEAGLVITQDELSHALIAGDAMMEATYAFGLSHKSGVESPKPVKHTGLAAARNTKGGYDDKALNKCHTAARKYFILGLFQIPTGDIADPDDDEDKPDHGKANGNGHHEPAPSSRKNESDVIRKAREWTNEQMSVLIKLKTTDDLDIWLDRWHKDVERLKTLVPDEHTALKAAMARAQMRLNPLAAG